MSGQGLLAATLVALGAAVALGRFTRASPRLPGPPATAAIGTTTHHTSAIRGRTRPSPGSVSEWTSDLSRHLRGGTTLRETLRTTVPSEPDLQEHTAPLRLALEHGQPVGEALAALPTGTDSTHVELVAIVLAACHEAGGSAAEPLDRAAVTLRGRAADLEERNAHSSQARLSAQVMTVLPLASLALLATSDPVVREQLRAPAGMTTLALGLGLNGIGWWWMRRIVRSAE